MSSFLDRFPKIPYDINKNMFSNYENITDLTFRFSIIKEVLNNISAYYEYTIIEGETPEILADRVYGDPGAYWMILYANEIYDPQYDWPMNQDVFDKYVAGKYGSLSAAKNGIHHYEKVIGRQIENSEVVYIDRQVVGYNAQTTLVCTLNTATSNASTITNGEVVVQTDPVTQQFLFNAYILSYDTETNVLTLQPNYGKLENYKPLFVPAVSENLGIVIDNNQEYLDFFESLPETPRYTTYTLNNKRINEVVSRNAISFYDHELELNESKRLIKVIKKEYYNQILREFDTMTKTVRGSFRRLV